MSKQYNSALQAKVRQYIKETGLSQAKVAPMLGMSGTLLSQYLSSKYPGDVAAQEQKLEEFFRAQVEKVSNAQKAMQFQPVKGYIPISVSEDVYKMIRYAQIEKGMVVIHGDAGIGKSKAAHKFEADNPTATVYIQTSPATGTLREVLRSLARELKLADNVRTGDLTRAVRAKLAEGRKVVIIDEAQHLNYKALEELTRWPDPERHTGEAEIALVLMGNTEVYSRMRGRQEAAFACQFNRMRLPKCYHTTDIQREDVEKLFPFLGDQGLTRETEFLLGICRSKWGVRGAVNVYNNAVNNEDISYNGLYSMARTMGIGLV